MSDTNLLCIQQYKFYKWYKYFNISEKSILIIKLTKFTLVKHLISCKNYVWLSLIVHLTMEIFYWKRANVEERLRYASKKKFHYKGKKEMPKITINNDNRGRERERERHKEFSGVSRLFYYQIACFLFDGKTRSPLFTHKGKLTSLTPPSSYRWNSFSLSLEVHENQMSRQQTFHFFCNY